LDALTGETSCMSRARRAARRAQLRSRDAMRRGDSGSAASRPIDRGARSLPCRAEWSARPPSEAPRHGRASPVAKGETGFAGGVGAGRNRASRRHSRSLPRAPGACLQVPHARTSARFPRLRTRGRRDTNGGHGRRLRGR
jgi:hypothetical protein